MSETDKHSKEGAPFSFTRDDSGSEWQIGILNRMGTITGLTEFEKPDGSIQVIGWLRSGPPQGEERNNLEGVEEGETLLTHGETQEI